jgi:hypothetical protein
MMENNKKEFLNTLIDTMRDDILRKADNFPEDWTAYEMRTYVKDRFNEVVWPGKELKGKQKRDYKNDIMINNL